MIYLLNYLLFAFALCYSDAYVGYVIALSVVMYIGLLPYTWMYYLSVMNLKRNRKYVHPKLIKYVMLLVYDFAITDFLLNMAMSLPLLELPKWGTKDKNGNRELLLTQRLDRILHDGKVDWRNKVAKVLVATLLNNFDPSIWHVDLRDAD